MDDDRLNRIEERLIELSDKLGEINVATAENSVVLQDHIRRSLANEEQNKLLRELLDLYKSEMTKKIAPLEQFVDRAKFVGVLVSAAFSGLLLADKLGLINFLFSIK